MSLDGHPDERPAKAARTLEAELMALASPVPRRWAIFVDAGYLCAAAGELLFGTGRRRELRIDGPGLVEAILREAESGLPGEMLRLYWFDAARDRVPTVDQRELARLEHVKVRLGNLNRQGQQKGVDAQVRGDLAALARNAAITDAVLITGDEDMVPAVEDAQAHGTQVHLWGVEPPYGSNQSERLVWEADTVSVLPRAFVAPFVSLVQPLAAAPAADSVPALADLGIGKPGAVPASSDGASLSALGDVHAPTPADVFRGRRPQPAPFVASGAGAGPSRDDMLMVGEHVAQKWLLTRGRENLADLLPGPFLPQSIDRELLVDAEGELGTSLRPHDEARRWLRDGFWARLYREFGITVS